MLLFPVRSACPWLGHVLQLGALQIDVVEANSTWQIQRAVCTVFLLAEKPACEKLQIPPNILKQPIFRTRHQQFLLFWNKVKAYARGCCMDCRRANFSSGSWSWVRSAAFSANTMDAVRATSSSSDSALPVDRSTTRTYVWMVSIIYYLFCMQSS